MRRKNKKRLICGRSTPRAYTRLHSTLVFHAIGQLLVSRNDQGEGGVLPILEIVLSIVWEVGA